MSKKTSFRAKDVGGPPEHSAWVWHTSELLRSAAWHGASPTLRRVLDYLEIEHLRHERRENGNLMALYGDLVKFGVSRGLILKTLQEGEARGLLRVEHGFRIPANGKQAPNRFRLTYLPTCTFDPKSKATTWCRATDEWRRYVEPARVRRNILVCTKMVPGSVPRTVLGDETESSVSAKNRVPHTVPRVGTLDGTASTYLQADLQTGPCEGEAKTACILNPNNKTALSASAAEGVTAVVDGIVERMMWRRGVVRDPIAYDAAVDATRRNTWLNNLAAFAGRTLNVKAATAVRSTPLR
jgi:hypothetical protein